MFRRGKLISESEWTRVYEAEMGSQRVMDYESKFLADGLRVSADSIMSRWNSFSLAEKLDFANAFAAKREITPEDERVLDFLMEAGDFYIWSAIALRLRHHHDKDRILAFLVEIIKEEREHKANFFQALELLGDARATPVLHAAYDSYREELRAQGGPPERFQYIDYLTCCKALWVLDGSSEYKEAIEALLQSEDATASAFARQLLSGK